MGVAVVNMVAALVFVTTPFFNVYVACILMMILQKRFCCVCLEIRDLFLAIYAVALLQEASTNFVISSLYILTLKMTHYTTTQ